MTIKEKLEDLKVAITGLAEAIAVMEPDDEEFPAMECALERNLDIERTKQLWVLFGDANIRKESLHLVHTLKHIAQYYTGNRLYVLVLSIRGVAQPIAWWSRESVDKQKVSAMAIVDATSAFGYALFDATKNGQFSLVSTRQRQ